MVGNPSSKILYVWDSTSLRLDDQDKQLSLFSLAQTDKWVIWKTTDMVFQIPHLYLVPQLKQEDFHQIIRLLHENRVKKATTELGIQD